MTIHEFHSKIQTTNASNPLFRALRQLRTLGDVRSAAPEPLAWAFWK